MNAYRFEDLKIGMRESFEYHITPDRMTQFMELTGDTNPLHTTEAFAEEHGFMGRVVYGMLTASLISTLGGVYLPGKYCLIQQVETKFAAPVYIGDDLTVLGEVKELHESVKRAVIKVTVTDQNGRKVLKGTLCAGFLE